MSETKRKSDARRNRLTDSPVNLLRPMLGDNPQHCDFCKLGHVTRHDQHVEFRQWTDRGYVSCRVTIPLGVCDRCRSTHWNQDAEAIVEGAVRREYEKLLIAA
jgi:hypothetical protein